MGNGRERARGWKPTTDGGKDFPRCGILPMDLRCWPGSLKFY